MNADELQKRLKDFAYKIVPLCELLPPRKVSQVIEGQLLRSAFSAAANYRAACKAQSKKAFTSKLSIAFEEIDESLFWLEAIDDVKLIKTDQLLFILKEADELTRILASSRKTSQQRGAR
ncbi:MAG: four helix bundle protein [Chitinophagaceae bacterium]